MSFRKTCQNLYILTRKVYFSSRNSLSHIAMLRAAPSIYARSNILLVSAAVGLSVYIGSQRKLLAKETALLEIVENTEIDDLNTSGNTEAIRRSRDVLQRVKDEIGAPGLVVGVSINGNTVWEEGFGYADVENSVPCSADTVMRIASISKSITMTAVAKLWEQGKLDLDKPVQHYVPYFPSKTLNGNPVTITCRQLVSHLGGIRHYDKNVNATVSKKAEKDTDNISKKNRKSEFDYVEYYIKDHYKDVASALNIFKDDPLIANPGSKYYYSTHGWTLVSAIVEAASKEPFSTHMTKLFKSLGMSTTYLDVNDVLIYHRSRNYVKDKKGKLINAPYVDNSYKFAGGGFLSTVGDLLQFGNAMLYSFQYRSNVHHIENQKQFENEKNIKNMDKINSNNPSEYKINFSSNKRTLPGYLKQKTVETLWTPVTDAKESKYGMGWAIIPETNECLFCENKKFCVYHLGMAVGASSVLLILPQKTIDCQMTELKEVNGPNGIVVTIITNLQSVKLREAALKIAEIFDNYKI